jgi:hypothetical protein
MLRTGTYILINVNTLHSHSSQNSNGKENMGFSLEYTSSLASSLNSLSGMPRSQPPGQTP